MKDFLKNKKLVISVSSSLVILLIVGTIFCLIKPKKMAESESSEMDVSKIQSDVVIENPDDNLSASSTEAISDDGNALVPDENVEVAASKNTGVKAEPTAEAKSAVTTTSEESEPASSAETATYVQDANPNTGISWDGVSPILYHYADGTSGTEKKYGGYYELRPNKWVLVETPMESVEWDGKCSHCGKVSGNGTNGSCVRWMMGDMTCPNCGAFVPGNTCHTCE